MKDCTTAQQQPNYASFNSERVQLVRYICYTLPGYPKKPLNKTENKGSVFFLSIKLPLKLHQLIEFVFSNDLIYWAPHRPVFRGVLRNPPRGLSGPEQVPVKRQSPGIARDVRISVG